MIDVNEIVHLASAPAPKPHICQHCKHWNIWGGARTPTGDCGAISGEYDDSCLARTPESILVTKPDFGCNLWEDKDD